MIGLLQILLWVVFGVLAVIAAIWALAWNTGDYHDEPFTYDGEQFYLRVKDNHWLPKWTPWHEFGFTLGTQTFCTGVLLAFPVSAAHEAGHLVRRLRRIRALRAKGYPRLAAEAVAFSEYLLDGARHGYHDNPEEVWCRAFGAAEWRQFQRR